MAAGAATSPSSMASRVIVSYHFGARRGNWDGVNSSFLTTATSSSSRRIPPLQLRTSRPSRFQSLVAYAPRGKNASAAKRSGSSKKGKQSWHADDVEEDTDEDAFEALFSLLEEDLKNDNVSDDDIDDEITEEDLTRLEEELAAALGDEDDDDVRDDLTGDMPSEPSDLESLNDSDEDEEEYRPPKLKNWQLRRLASALKHGRRKTSIKNLAAELGLDRAVVLDLLREPPPNLLLMAASLPDKAAESPPETNHEQSAPVESLPVQADVAGTESKEKEMPVHVMKTKWSIKKRLKKVQVETLKRVYARTKRPTNAMIGSIVHVTNLPWKTVVKWFEDKRVQDGVPMQRAPFRRSENETVFSR